MATAVANPHVTVTLPAGTTQIELTDEPLNVGAALVAAGNKIGVNVNPDKLTAIKDGDQIATDDQVQPGDEITGAPQVGNG